MIMIEKIEITQRFNFKRLNRHYECFTIDFANNMAYYKISEREAGTSSCRKVACAMIMD